MSIKFVLTVLHFDKTQRNINEPELWHYLVEPTPGHWTLDGERYQQCNKVAPNGFELGWRHPTEDAELWNADRVTEEMRKRKEEVCSALKKC